MKTIKLLSGRKVVLSSPGDPVIHSVLGSIHRVTGMPSGALYVGAVIPLFIMPKDVKFVIDINRTEGGLLPVLDSDTDTITTEDGTFELDKVALAEPTIISDWQHIHPGCYCQLRTESGLQVFKYYWVKNISGDKAEIVSINMSMGPDGTLTRTYKELTVNLCDLFLIHGYAPESVQEQIRTGELNLMSPVSGIDTCIPLKEEQYPRK